MKSIRTYICLVLAVLVCMSVFAGCGSTAKDGFDAEMEIGVITRESGSGTRGAFIELFGIEEKNEGCNGDSDFPPGHHAHAGGSDPGAGSGPYP